jgi:hypothetical protein
MSKKQFGFGSRTEEVYNSMRLQKLPGGILFACGNSVYAWDMSGDPVKVMQADEQILSIEYLDGEVYYTQHGSIHKMASTDLLYESERNIIDLEAHKDKLYVLDENTIGVVGVDTNEVDVLIDDFSMFSFKKIGKPKCIGSCGEDIIISGRNYGTNIMTDNASVMSNINSDFARDVIYHDGKIYCHMADVIIEHKTKDGTLTNIFVEDDLPKLITHRKTDGCFCEHNGVLFDATKYGNVYKTLSESTEPVLSFGYWRTIVTKNLTLYDMTSVPEETFRKILSKQISEDDDNE